MRTATSILCLLAILSCSRRDREADQSAERSDAGTSAAAAAGAREGAAAGDVRIVSTGAEVDLALVGDTISSGLSQQALARARPEIDSSRVSGTGLGASIEKMVKGTVQSALGTRVAFPISALNDVRYESGRIVFDWKERPAIVFAKTSINGKPFLESFRPEDAQRFVSAVRARKRARGL